MWLKVAEGVAIFLAAVVLLSQILLPAIRGQRLFPMFRRRWQLERELTEVNESIEDCKLDAEITKRRRKTKA